MSASGLNLNKLFKPDELTIFTGNIKKYCAEVSYRDFELNSDEYEQLFLYMGSATHTPQATLAELNKILHVEIQRGLARRYSFELLLRGDQLAYQDFIKAQTHPVLSYQNFLELSKEAKSLSPNHLVVIRASCFLSTINEKVKYFNDFLNLKISYDSEEALSQLSKIFITQPGLYPINSLLNEEQLALLPKMYWPGLHFRNLMFTEGGENILATFIAGIKDKTFDAEAFTLWKWRWLTNLFGFNNGPSARYYNDQIHELAHHVITELQKVMHDQNYPFLDKYLSLRAELAGISVANNLEQNFLGHVIAFFNKINILTPQLGQAVIEGYRAYQNNFSDKGELASAYDLNRHDLKIITASYAPAVLNKTFEIFSKTHNEKCALKLSVEFGCQFLHDLYRENQTYKAKISCMDIAQEKNLMPIIEKWFEDKHQIKFMRINDKMIFEQIDLRLHIRRV